MIPGDVGSAPVDVLPELVTGSQPALHGRSAPILQNGFLLAVWLMGWLRPASRLILVSTAENLLSLHNFSPRFDCPLQLSPLKKKKWQCSPSLSISPGLGYLKEFSVKRVFSSPSQSHSFAYLGTAVGTHSPLHLPAHICSTPGSKKTLRCLLTATDHWSMSPTGTEFAGGCALQAGSAWDKGLVD